jgi:hypothetical protein
MIARIATLMPSYSHELLAMASWFSRWDIQNTPKIATQPTHNATCTNVFSQEKPGNCHGELNVTRREFHFKYNHQKNGKETANQYLRDRSQIFTVPSSEPKYIHFPSH